MPKVEKAERREKQQHKNRHGMRVSNRSIKTVILTTIQKKAKEAKRGT